VSIQQVGVSVVHNLTEGETAAHGVEPMSKPARGPRTRLRQRRHQCARGEWWV